MGLDRQTLVSLLRRAEREEQYDEMDTWYCVCRARGPTPIVHDRDCPIAAALELLSESVERATEEQPTPPPPPPTVWDAIDVALDRFKMQDDLDPAPLGDMLVLFGFAHLIGCDVVGTLMEGGWSPPPAIDDWDPCSVPASFLRYTYRLAQAWSEEDGVLVATACMVDPADPHATVRVWSHPWPKPQGDAPADGPVPSPVVDPIELTRTRQAAPGQAGRQITGGVDLTITDAHGEELTIEGVQFDWSIAEPVEQPRNGRHEVVATARRVAITQRVHEGDLVGRLPRLGTPELDDPSSPRNRAERRARRRGTRTRGDRR